MSHRFQVVLPDPVAAQLPAGRAHGEPPSTIAAHMVRGAVGGGGGHRERQTLRSAPSVARERPARVRGGLSRTGETAIGALRCGVRSWRFAARYPRHLGDAERRSGGPTSRTPRCCVRWPCGEATSTTGGRTLEKSSRSKRSSPNTPQTLRSRGRRSRRGVEARRPAGGVAGRPTGRRAVPPRRRT